MNTLSKLSCGNSLFKTPTAILGLILLFAIGTSQLQARRVWQLPKRSFCEKVAFQAFTSDLIEASADYTLARAKALNIDDAEARGEAYTEAYEEYLEAREEAGDQLVARLDLCGELEEERYYPEIDPENFCSPEEIAANPNPFFILVPGRVMIYEGLTEEGELEHIEVTVTEETVEILGIECIEVRDIVSVIDPETMEGEIIEDTRDWYTQDKAGNVWYFGEIALNFEDGQVVDIDGSWKAGVYGALPGILVYALPQVGLTHRQEFLLGEAEDVAQLEAIGVTVTANGVEYTDCRQTLEYSPLEPDDFEYKYAKEGVGVVLEENPDTEEHLDLIEIIEPD